MRGQGKDSLPEEGKEGVKALAVGCSAYDDGASARSADCDRAVGGGNGYFAGAVAVPQLKLKQ